MGASPDPLEASLRQVPVLMWKMATDELVPEASYYPTAHALDADNYRYELDIFAPGDHLTLVINDQYAPAAAFLGTATVNPNPAHVTYAVEPSLDYSTYGFVSDHAYWLSSIRVRDASQKTGNIDVFSHGFGQGDPPASPTQFGSGTLTGGTLPAIAYSRQYKTWGVTPGAAGSDQLDIRASNVSQSPSTSAGPVWTATSTSTSRPTAR